MSNMFHGGYGRSDKTAYMRIAVRAQAERGLRVIVVVPNEESEAAMLMHMADWSGKARRNVDIRESSCGSVLPCDDPSLVHLFERDEG